MKNDGMLVAHFTSRTDGRNDRISEATQEPATETAFCLAARRFDPCALTRSEMDALADQLRRDHAISDRDYMILQTDPTAGRMAVARDRAAPRNAIQDWQERRATDMELGRIQAVEASTRALAILGRVAALRDDPKGP